MRACQQQLEAKWGYTCKDFDFPVLNYLAKMSPEQQVLFLLGASLWGTQKKDEQERGRLTLPI